MAETPSSYKRFAQSDKISQGITNAALSLNDYLPGQHVTGPNNNDIAATLAQVQAIPIGTATLSGNTYNVTISNYPNTATIYPGQKISVKFNADAPTADDTALNLSAFGQSLPLCARGVRMGQGAIKSGMILELVYRGDMWNADYDVVKANRGNNGYTTFADGSKVYNAFYIDRALDKCGRKFSIGDIGSSLSQYLVFELGSPSPTAMIDLSITDYYGGQIHITGSPYIDIAFGSSYNSIKVKRLINGDTTTDTEATFNKITKVYLSVTNTAKLLVINFGTYGNINVQDFSNYEMPYFINKTAPTETRVITMQ